MMLSFRSRPQALPLVWLASTATLLFSGCGTGSGPPRAPVQGTVSIGGAPLHSGFLRFVPINGTEGPIVVAEVSDGTYSLASSAGPVVGMHRVEVEETNFLGFDLADESAFQLARHQKMPLPKSSVPPKYRRNSPLRATIPAEGLEDLHFRLGAR